MFNQTAFNKLINALQTETPFEEMSVDAIEYVFETKLASRLLLKEDEQFGELKTLCVHHLQALKDYSTTASELSLEFVVLKGIPLSQKLYGKPWARASSDIDIAVLREDVPKAHTAALRAGFIQAAESYRARQLAAKGMLNEAMLQGISSPFPIKTSIEAPHLSPYLRIEDDGSLVVLEIHDSYKGLPQELEGPLVLSGNWENVEGFKLPTPPDAFSFIVLCLAAHEECEGLRSNMQPGPLGVKYLIDLHKWLEIGAPLREVSNIAFTYGLTRAFGELFFDLAQVFSDSWARLDPFFPLYESSWGMSYTKRLASAAERRMNTLKAINAAASAHDNGAVVWGEMRRSMPLAKGRLLKTDEARVIEWLIDECALERALPGLIFDTVLLNSPIKESGQLSGEGFLLFREDQGAWRLKRRTVDGRDLDGHVSKRRGDDAAFLLDITRRHELTRIAVELPGEAGISKPELAAFHAVYRHEYAGIYHRLAGETPSGVLMNIIREGLLLKDDRADSESKTSS